MCGAELRRGQVFLSYTSLLRLGVCIFRHTVRQLWLTVSASVVLVVDDSSLVLLLVGMCLCADACGIIRRLWEVYARDIDVDVDNARTKL